MSPAEFAHWPPWYTFGKVSIGKYTLLYAISQTSVTDFKQRLRHENGDPHHDQSWRRPRRRNHRLVRRQVPLLPLPECRGIKAMLVRVDRQSRLWSVKGLT